MNFYRTLFILAFLSTQGFSSTDKVEEDANNYEHMLRNGTIKVYRIAMGLSEDSEEMPSDEDLGQLQKLISDNAQREKVAAPSEAAPEKWLGNELNCLSRGILGVRADLKSGRRHEYLHLLPSLGDFVYHGTEVRLEDSPIGWVAPDFFKTHFPSVTDLRINGASLLSDSVIEAGRFPFKSDMFDGLPLTRLMLNNLGIEHFQLSGFGDLRDLDLSNNPLKTLALEGLAEDCRVTFALDVYATVGSEAFNNILAERGINTAGSA